jgi:hypothetical protein
MEYRGETARGDRAPAAASSPIEAQLETAILTEQKVAKLIELSEETRRDSPFLNNRIDDAMSTPADPAAVLEAFKETSANPNQAGTIG